MHKTLEALRSGHLAGSKRLQLACDLTEFPQAIFTLADSLEVLDLSNNQLSALPDEFGCLKQLKIAFFSNNNFEELPAVLSQCPKLSMVGFKSNRIRYVSDTALSPTIRWLILTNNQIQALPASIGTLKMLQKLMLAGNQLQSLPVEMAACDKLELVRLSANQLTTLPDWLLRLPRLTWLAYSGNPFCADFGKRSPSNTSSKSKNDLLDIDWTELTPGDLLGQGASGLIFKGVWQAPATAPQAIAIKLFKGAMTSDGLPSDEMQACIAAGNHPNLVRVLGRIIHHPEQKVGLVFSLIPADYDNLGNPPDFDTCTRDTFPADTTLSLRKIIRIAQGISSVSAHLHEQGIMHGDLYAHNILVNGQGDSLLSDFGAASFYEPEQTGFAEQLELLEVRAFGCLLEDLLGLCIQVDIQTHPEVFQTLQRLQNSCLREKPRERSRFTEICKTLSTLEFN